nr:MAG TPA: hypothetical protein [Caudoviricetes sp.]
MLIPKYQISHLFSDTSGTTRTYRFCHHNAPYVIK